MPDQRTSFRRRLVGALAATSVIATLLAGAAIAATTTKPYHVDVETDSVFAGAHQTYTVRIYNDSNQPVIGSANWTVNSAFTDLALAAVPGGSATFSGNTILLRNLNIAAGTSKAFTYEATAPCLAGAYGNTVNAKQSNDYKGPPGNDFILDTTPPDPISDLGVEVTGDCELAFAFGDAPADSQIDTNITTAIYDPTGDPIRVVVLDGSNSAIATKVDGTVTLDIGHDAGCDLLPDPCESTLSGDRTEDLADGVATFSRTPGTTRALTIDQSGLGFTLVATGSGVTPKESPEFNVQDVGKICTTGPCQGVANGKQFDATYVLDADADAGDLLTVGVTTDIITCTSLGFTPHTDTIVTDFTGDGTKTLTMTFTNTANEPKSSFRVCYSQPDLLDVNNQPVPWVDRFGATKVGTDESYLQDCSKTTPSDTPPCVISVDNDKKQIIIKVLLPEGDPKGRG